MLDTSLVSQLKCVLVGACISEWVISEVEYHHLLLCIWKAQLCMFFLVAYCTEVSSISVLICIVQQDNYVPCTLPVVYCTECNS